MRFRWSCKSVSVWNQDVIGAKMSKNGQGKSTLARLIVGELKPLKGNIVRHPQLRIGYFSQVN